MIVSFKKADKEYIGEVVGEGFFNVDGPEFYEINVATFPHIRFIVPMTECKPV